MKALSKETRNRDLREELKENSKNYETIAIELLNQCYYDNAKLAQRVVIAAVSELNDRTCLDMVFHSHLLKFMSHVCYQSLVEKIWNGHIRPGHSFFRIILTCLFPPLLFTLDYRKKPSVKQLISLPSNHVCSLPTHSLGINLGLENCL